MRPTNLFAGIPRSLPDELVETLLESGAARIERIVSRGHSSPEGQWYDQPEHEWVALLQGSARLAFDDGSPDIDLLPGDFLFIPARRRHRVAWTDSLQDNVWLAIFLPA